MSATADLDHHAARPIHRLGVIGDVHAEHQRLGTVLDWLTGAGLDAIVCTGDLADGDGCLDTTCNLLIQGQVRCVAGNHDRWLLRNRLRHLPQAHRLEALDECSVEYLASLEKSIELATAAGPLMLCHGVADNDLGKVWPGTERSPIERNATVDEMVTQAHFRLMINGHLHYRVLIDFERLLIMNAGTLCGQHPGVSIFDFDTGQLTVHELAAAGKRGLIQVTEQPLCSSDRQIWADTQAFDGCWQPAALYAPNARF